MAPTTGSQASSSAPRGTSGRSGWPGYTTSPCRAASGLPRARSFSSTKNLAARLRYAASERSCSSYATAARTTSSGEVVALGDLVDRLAGVGELPEPLGRHAATDGRPKRTSGSITTGDAGPAGWSRAHVAVTRRIELDLLEELLGGVGQEDLLA